MGQLGEQLAALERLRRGEVSVVSAYPHLACGCLYGLGRLSTATSCRGRDAERLVSGAALLLGSGRARLQELAAAGDDATEAGVAAAGVIHAPQPGG